MVTGNSGVAMNTTRTTRLTGLLGAMLMTVSVNAALLWQFDAVAQRGPMAANTQAPAGTALALTAVAARRA